MSMTRNYYELIDDLRFFRDRPLIARAAKAIEELLTIHELDQSEIVRLRRQIEILQMSEEEKLEDLQEVLREGGCVLYRGGKYGD